MLNALPNALTLLRLVLAPAILAAVALHHTGLAWWFIAGAGLSDLLDGALARALKAQSRFGERLDPIADKAVVSAALAPIAIAYFGQSAMPGIAVFCAAAVIIVRDWAVELLRLAEARQGRSLVPSPLAKLKTLVEYGALLTIYGASGFGAAGALFGPDLLRYGFYALILAALLSALTGFRYAFAVLGPGAAEERSS